jgi:FkbM family methyltransferase
MTTIEEFEKNYENFMVGSVDTMVSYLKEGDVFLDIGANTGLVSSKIYDRVKLGKLILIEPIKPYYEECIRKFSNKDNVEFYNIGFSDENGIKKFLCSEYNLGYNKIYEETMEIHPHFVEEIYCYRFSDWVGDRRIDFIKIDGSFIRNLHLNGDDQAFVKALADVAKQKQISTVAEMVEHEGVMTALQGLGIDFGQGYFFAPPQPDLPAVGWDKAFVH